MINNAGCIPFTILVVKNNMESLMCPSFKTMVTPLATPIMKATANKLSAPFINSRTNIFSFIPVITASKIEEPRNSADISVVHQSKKTTPPIIVRKVAT